MKVIAQEKNSPSKKLHSVEVDAVFSGSNTEAIYLGLYFWGRIFRAFLLTKRGDTCKVKPKGDQRFFTRKYLFNKYCKLSVGINSVNF